jgi:ribulose-phosphate 3-epimerase
MAEVAVTLLAQTAADYGAAVKRIEKFVRRLHIDISDGIFTPTKTIDLAQVYDLPEVTTDLHLMISHPRTVLATVISLGPTLEVCHDEVAANWPELFNQWQEAGIKVGLALGPETLVASITHLLPQLDHVLVFTGDHLGFNHSHFQSGTLAKIAEIKAKKPSIEVGVDGGLDPQHAAEAVAAGADVINAGGYIHGAKNPQAAYAELVAAVETAK